MEKGIFEVDAGEPVSLRDHLENVCRVQHTEAENFDYLIQPPEVEDGVKAAFLLRKKKVGGIKLTQVIRALYVLHGLLLQKEGDLPL